jgi:hypothetical protein
MNKIVRLVAGYFLSLRTHTEQSNIEVPLYNKGF